MKVLIACEFSGIVREAFKARGHDAWSCDLLDTEIPGQHIKGNVVQHLNMVGVGYYDLIIAHPECTYIANSGVIHMMNQDGTIKDRNRWSNMISACEFFNLFVPYAKKVCRENPIPHKYAIERIGGYDQIVHPWLFGHTTQKGTCLWLQNLPPLIYSFVVPKHLRTDEIHKEPPGPDRKKNRSRTFTGIAKAMAEQWG
jgi:hypothetical protein